MKLESATVARFRAIILLLACAAPVLPARAGLFDDDAARRQIAEQQQRLDKFQTQLDTLSGRLAKLEEAAKSPPASPLLDLANQIETLREEVRSLRGQIEVTNNNIQGVDKRQRDMYVDLDTRLRRIEKAGQPPAAPGSTTPGAGAPATPAGAGAAASSGGAPAAAAPASAAPAVPPSTASEEKQAYDAAQNERGMGNYEGAIAAFQAFITKHPKSVLAPRAQYWIGDSYFNLREYKKAIASQQKLLANYGDSSSVPDALLNIGSCQLELGDAAAARKSMESVVARYPTSDAAEKAKRRLETLH